MQIASVGIDLGKTTFHLVALDKDPNDARAYAGLAASYMLLSAHSLSHGSDYASRARAAALRALQLDDNLPEAHTALALVVQNYDWNWQAAEKEFRRAIELDPNYATALCLSLLLCAAASAQTSASSEIPR